MADHWLHFMAHKRKGTLAEIKKTDRWNKHLKPFGKRLQAQQERRAAKKDIQGRLVEQ